LRKPELLFSKIDNKTVENQVNKLIQATQSEGAKPTDEKNKEEKQNPVKPEISFDDFSKLDLRVGTITAAEKVKKTDKLLKLTIDLGFEKRTVVSGLAKQHNTRQLIGKQVTVVANLDPSKMRGIVSEGMILMAEEKDGKLIFINTDEPTEPGSSIN